MYGLKPGLSPLLGGKSTPGRKDTSPHNASTGPSQSDSPADSDAAGGWLK